MSGRRSSTRASVRERERETADENVREPRSRTKERPTRRTKVVDVVDVDGDGDDSSNVPQVSKGSVAGGSHDGSEEKEESVDVTLDESMKKEDVEKDIETKDDVDKENDKENDLEKEGGNDEKDINEAANGVKQKMVSSENGEQKDGLVTDDEATREAPLQAIAPQGADVGMLESDGKDKEVQDEAVLLTTAVETAKQKSSEQLEVGAEVEIVEKEASDDILPEGGDPGAVPEQDHVVEDLIEVVSDSPTNDSNAKKDVAMNDVDDSHQNEKSDTQDNADEETLFTFDAIPHGVSVAVDPSFTNPLADGGQKDIAVDSGTAEKEKDQEIDADNMEDESNRAVDTGSIISPDGSGAAKVQADEAELVGESVVKTTQEEDHVEKENPVCVEKDVVDNSHSDIVTEEFDDKRDNQDEVMQSVDAVDKDDVGKDNDDESTKKDAAKKDDAPETVNNMTDQDDNQGDFDNKNAVDSVAADITGNDVVEVEKQSKSPSETVDDTADVGKEMEIESSATDKDVKAVSPEAPVQVDFEEIDDYIGEKNEDAKNGIDDSMTKNVEDIRPSNEASEKATAPDQGHNDNADLEDTVEKKQLCHQHVKMLR